MEGEGRCGPPGDLAGRHTGAKGNDGVSRTVRQTRNSIGYVEFAHAQQNRLAYTLIRNPAGNFVVPSPQAFQTAAGTADWKEPETSSCC